MSRMLGWESVELLNHIFHARAPLRCVQEKRVLELERMKSKAETACKKLEHDVLAIKQQKVGWGPSEGLVLSSAALQMRGSAHMCFPAQLCRGVQLGRVDGRCIALLNVVDLPSILPMLLSPLQVSLHRTMEKSAKEFAEWKKQRDRELLQLKKQGRLNAAQLQKLEALHSKQQAVLRRKTGAWRGQLLVCCCICGHA